MGRFAVYCQPRLQASMEALIERPGIIPDLKQQLRTYREALARREPEVYGTVEAQTAAEARRAFFLSFPDVDVRRVVPLEEITPAEAYEIGHHEGQNSIFEGR